MQRVRAPRPAAPSRGSSPVAARNVPPTISGPQTEEHAGLAQAVVLEPDRRGDVEDRDEQAGQREGEDERAADRGQVEHQRGVDDVDGQDRGGQLALRDPARQDRVRRVERPDVALGVDAAGRVEVVVDHVVRGVGEHEPDDARSSSSQ